MKEIERTIENESALIGLAMINGFFGMFLALLGSFSEKIWLMFFGASIIFLSLIHILEEEELKEDGMFLFKIIYSLALLLLISGVFLLII